MSWSGLDDINDVAPLSDDDRAVLDDVRAVLAKHDALSRFGLTLLHSHFHLAADEVLVESVDAKARTLTTQATRVADLSEGELAQTSWRLDADPSTPVTVTYCYRNGEFHMC